ncbi:ribosomal protein S6 modification protein [Thermoproteus tenax Kra 1]|uniref:Ribosomal protein S6 modification protein n=1 Tax=Thermoproteus tenax (strain ATCC 35583 / DSM 2078 / JCM 9277 / NBRC 100435 / Kra 1) TaxID=768679 RepID=G4RQ81_THETK|nr:ribosomal protein S6 modification protein [Thermoproteus tenax Kra 1]
MKLVVDLLKEEERMLLKAAERLGVKAELVKVDGLDLSTDVDEGVYLIRALSHNRAVVAAAHIESSGSISINSWRALAAGWNKAVALSFLRASGIPIPRTRLAPAIPNAEEFIVKPAFGSWGRKVALAKSKEDVEALLKGVDPDEVYLVQERIGDGTDIRAFVVGYRVVAAMIRRPPPGDWRSNAARGGHVEGIKPDAEVEDLAIKATRALNAEYAGVDILMGNGEYYVGEVNVIPEFKAVSKASGVDVAEELLKYVKELEKK